MVMFKRLLILSLSLIVVLALIAPISPVYAKRDKLKMNLKGSGTIVNNVLIMPDPNVPAVIIPHFLITLSVHGLPGSAEGTVLGYGHPVDPDPYPDCVYYIEVDQNEMTLQFSDLSLLFSEHSSGFLCIGFDGITRFEVTMDITGGTDRFEGVTGGQLTGSGRSYYVGGGSLSGETINIIGTIDFSE